MADRTEISDCLVPAGTLQAAPVTFNLNHPQGVLERLEIIVPAGPSGLVGFQVAYNGTVLLPGRTSGFFITDDQKIDWAMSNYPTGGRWQIVAYNTDVNDHTLHTWWHYTEVWRMVQPMVRKDPGLLGLSGTVMTP